MPASLLIKNLDYVITIDRERRIIRDGAIAITGDRIAAVGKSAELAPNFADADVVDGRGKLALPGLFDTHIHNAQQLGRGLGDEAYSGPERLFRRLWVVESHMESGDALCAARLCQLELLRAGTTCFADPGSYFAAETAQAARESGMRGVIARTVFDMGQTPMGSLPKNFFEPTDDALARADAMVEEFDGALDGRLKAWFSMRVPVACSDDLLRRLGKLAEKRGVGIIGHACENRDEIVASHLKYGMGDVARLEKLGLLGPNLLLLHMGWIDAKELMLLQKRDVKISLSPGASMHQAMGNMSHGKVPEMLELGIKMSLGSDAAMSGNFLDVIRQTYLLIGGYHEARLDPKVIRPETAVEMMTLGGAQCTLWDKELGSLEAGKKADVTILDIRRPEWQPIHNPINNLVYSAHGGCADTVIVDGKILMRGGKVLTLNENDLYEEARDRASSLVKRSGLKDVATPPWPMF
ncbi:MAG TPA: amidohydrolase [Pseudolabrys sp.]|jgi:5-methylthioadenosine/S-adenosylhomocysteine deaminase|nr:amidohydrolase [Pseudolabrys sp.]